MAQTKKNRHTKVVVTFDPAARRDFLSGFRKRKLERKKVGRLATEEKNRRNKKATRQEKRDLVKQTIEAMGPHPAELEAEDPADDKKPGVLSFDTPEQLVTVTTIAAVDLDDWKYQDTDSVILGKGGRGETNPRAAIVASTKKGGVTKKRKKTDHIKAGGRRKIKGRGRAGGGLSKGRSRGKNGSKRN